MRGAAALLAALCVLAAAGSARAAQAQVLDQVKISVDDKALTEREYSQLRTIEEQQLRQQFQGDELQQKLKELDAALTQRLIEELLLETYAARLKIVISDKEIEERVDNILRRQPNLQEVYTDEQLKSFVVKDLLRRRVLAREVDSRVRVTDEEIVAACRRQTADSREVDVGHILLRSTDAAARTELEGLRAKLLAGADFDTLAGEYSQDPSAKTNHGHLGFISRGQFVKPFEDAAFSLPVGAVSEPVQTQFGLHLIKVFAARDKGQVNCDKLDDVTRQSLQNKVFAEKRQQQLEQFLTRIRKDADIHVYGPQ
jgi:foldase protein PrsA